MAGLTKIRKLRKARGSSKIDVENLPNYRVAGGTGGRCAGNRSRANKYAGLKDVEEETTE